MCQNFKSIEAAANHSVAMETGDHSRNGTSLKSLMKGSFFTKNVLLIFMMIYASPTFAQTGLELSQQIARNREAKFTQNMIGFVFMFYVYFVFHLLWKNQKTVLHKIFSSWYNLGATIALVVINIGILVWNVWINAFGVFAICAMIDIVIIHLFTIYSLHEDSIRNKIRSFCNFFVWVWNDMKPKTKILTGLTIVIITLIGVFIYGFNTINSRMEFAIPINPKIEENRTQEEILFHDLAVRHLEDQLSEKELSDYEKKAKKHLKKANFAKAIMSVNTDISDREEAVKRLLFKAHLCIADFQFSEAETCYKQAADVFNSFDGNARLANLYTSQKRFPEAIYYYERCLTLANPEDEIIVALAGLGNAYLGREAFAQANKYYTQAIEIYRELDAKDKTQNIEPIFVAGILANLGLLQYNSGEYTQAGTYLTEALEIYHKLIAKNDNSDIYYYGFATILNLLGALLCDYHEEYALAETYFTESLEIYRELAAKSKDQDFYFPNIAATLIYIGALQKNNQEYTQAESSFTEALEIYRELSAKDRDTYLPNVATTLNYLGILQSDNNENTKAEVSFAEYLGIYRELAAENPEIYLPDVANILVNLSLFYQDTVPNKKLSLQYAHEAEELLHKYNEIPLVQELLGIVRDIIKTWKKK